MAAVAVGAVALLGVPQLASANAAETTITIKGTVAEGIEYASNNACLIVKDSGVEYLVLGGDPAVVAPGAQVTITGKLSPTTLTTCMQGTTLNVSSAART